MNWWNILLGGGVTYEKDIQGNDNYYIEGTSVTSDLKSNLIYATKHPILTPAMLFVSNLFAQGKFYAKNISTGEIVDHWATKLLRKPNFYQTQIDFLESLQFLKIAQGRAIIWLKRPVAFEPEEMYILRDDLITWPQDFKTELDFRTDLESLKSRTIVYDKAGMNLTIQIRDLLFLFDLPNIGEVANSTYGYSGNVNLFQAESRITGLRQTLQNTYDSLEAKNIILKSNGKEMLSSNDSSGVAPFGPDAKDDAKSAFNNFYGLGGGRSRAYITSANVNWQSLHVALRDLGLDESTKVDGNIVYTALHIPKDILSLEAKKTTYNNFKESMTSYIQNDIQAMANDLAETLWAIDQNEQIEIVGSYEHLPVMQFALMQRYQAANSQAVALTNLRKAGVPDQDALVLVDLPKTMNLNPLHENKTEEANGESGDGSETGGAEENDNEENE